MVDRIPHGYRSTAEYHFREEQADAILRTSAYHRKDYPLSVVWFSSSQHADILQSIATPFQRTANGSFGSLDRLPLELLHEILFSLDIYSLFKFRQINLRSRQTVDSLKEYQAVVAHGLNPLCALLRTRLAVAVSLFEFYDAICTKTCTLCDRFGGFVFLPTWTRCCFDCLQEAPETQVQTLASIRKQLDWTEAELDQMRPFKTLPGIYAMNESVCKSSATIVSTRLIISVHQQRPFVRSRLRPHAQLRAWTPAQPARTERNRNFRFMASCALPYHDIQTGQAEHGISCAGCQLAIERDLYSMGICPVVKDKIYARDSFLEHFRWCEQAQVLWRSSDEGNHQPAELPVTVQRGGYFNKRE